MEKETFSKYRDQVIRLEENISRRDVPKLKVISKLLTELKLVTLASSATALSRNLAIGSAAALLKAKKSESVLGIFSDDFDTLAEMAALGLAQNSIAKESVPLARVLKLYIELIFVATIGCLHLATKPKASFDESEEQGEASNPFYNELVLSLIFTSNYPKVLFLEVAESFEANAKGVTLIAHALEAAALLAAVISLSDGETGLKQNYYETIIVRLKKAIDLTLENTFEPIETGDEENQTAIFRAFLQQAKMAIERQDIDAFYKTFAGLISHFGLSENSLREDLEAIRKMFDNFEEAFTTKSNQRTMAVDMIG